MALAALGACSFHGLRPPRHPDNGGPLECSQDIGVPIFDAAWSLAMLGMSAYVYRDASKERNSVPLNQAAPLAMMSGLGMVSAGYGFVMISRCERAKKAEREAHIEAVQHRKERKQTLVKAWAVTQQAATAARSGDCATVQKLDAEVRDLDEDFHATVFRGDVAIARCVAAAAPDPAAPAP